MTCKPLAEFAPVRTKKLLELPSMTIRQQNRACRKDTLHPFASSTKVDKNP